MDRRIRLAASALACAVILAAAGFAAPACATKTPCQFNSDCVNEYCDNGVCKHDCVDSALDCASGHVCNAIGKCGVDDGSGGSTTGQGGGATTGTGGATTGGGGAGASGAGGLGAGGSHAGGATTTSTSTDAGVGGQGGGPALGRELDLCAKDADCASPLSCKPLVVAGKQRCTRACQSNGDCMAGTRCLTVGGAKACMGDDIGRSCNVATACNFACFTPGPGYCTVPCVSGADCPNGYGCMAVSGQRVCIKAEAEADQCSPVGPNKKCIVPAACDDTILVSSCTLACDSAADCPQRAAGLAPWNCDGLCRRPDDVTGPLPGGTAAEYACLGNQVVNLCNDAQHMNFATFSLPNPPQLQCPVNVSVVGSPGDSCVDSCRYQGGCPHGFGCTALGGVGNGRIGLCLPSGFGEVGANCQKDGDCAFAYCNKGICSRDCTADGICPTGSSCVVGGAPAVEGVPFRRCE